MLPREARRLDCQPCVGHAATFICYSSSRLKGPSPVLEVLGESKEVHWLGSIFDFLFIMNPSRTRWSDTTWNYSAIRSNKPVTKSKPGLCWQSSKPTSKINTTSTMYIRDNVDLEQPHVIERKNQRYWHVNSQPHTLCLWQNSVRRVNT